MRHGVDGRGAASALRGRSVKTAAERVVVGATQRRKIITSDLSFRIGEIEAGNQLVLSNHYSKRLCTLVRCVGTWHLPGGLLGDRGECIAACFFSIPGTRWSEPVLELTRLVRYEGPCPSLTSLVATTINYLAKAGHDLVVSFADSQVGHHGGIYQAASWHYNGKRSRRMDGLIVIRIISQGYFLSGWALV